ncbi:MAG: amidohydrolase, partial [Planctomycetaceae bacterium]
MQRRKFLMTSAAAAVMAGSGAVRAASTDERESVSIPKIDTHQHLWDLQKFQPPWLSSAPQVLSRSYVTSDYVEATRGLNIVKAMYMEVDVAVADQNREA